MTWRVVGLAFMAVGIILRFLFGADASTAVSWIVILSIVLGFFFVVTSFLLGDKKDLNSI